MNYLLNHQIDFRTHFRAGASLRVLISAFPLLVAASLVLSVSSCAGGTSISSSSPTANAGGPYFGNVGQAIAFNGTGSIAPSGQSLAYSWNFGDGTTGSGASPSHTYAISGDLTVTLTVTDSAGATNMTTVGVQVIPEPVASPGGPYSGTVGQSISFSGLGSSAPAGQSLSYAWGFGDGATATGATPSHAYGTSGTFTVSLKVTDDTAGTNSNNTQAVISAAGGAVRSVSLRSVTLLAVSSPASSAQQFAYLASSTANDGTTLSTNTVDAATGLLLANANPPLSLDSQFILSGMTLDPSSKFLYLYGGTAILNFVADPVTGTLKQQGSILVNGDIQTAGLLVFHPAGGFGFLPTSNPENANSTEAGIVTVYALDPNTGALTSSNTFPSQVQNPMAAAVDPLGRYLYVFGSEAGAPNAPFQVAGFSVNQETGALSPLPGSPFPAETQVSPTAMAVSPSGRFVYATGSSAMTGAATISVFSIDENSGALSELFNSPFSAGPATSSAVSMSLDPFGAFAYVLRAAASSDTAVQQRIQVFSLDPASGAVALINSQVLAEFAAITTASANIVVASASVAANVTGSAAAVGNSSIKNPAAHGRFLYVTNPANGVVVAFSIDRSTGVLSSISPTASGKDE
jgi:6-phosphogluconolactonase (cycloisomerase 2 family)/PKD repeat protein